MAVFDSETDFSPLLEMAEKRKGGAAGLQALLTPVADNRLFAALPDDRILAMMCRVVNQAGFSWKVIERKWPQFEEAYKGFDTDKLARLQIDDWEAFTKDKRVVRSWQKIKAVMDNCAFVRAKSDDHGRFAKFMMTYGPDRQVDLMACMKKEGSRLGGNSGQYLLRYLGRDSFVLSNDVILALRHSGLDIAEKPTSQRDMKAIQARFNSWHQQTNLPYTHLSQIAAFSIGSDRTSSSIEKDLKELGLD